MWVEGGVLAWAGRPLFPPLSSFSPFPPPFLFLLSFLKLNCLILSKICVMHA